MSEFDRRRFMKMMGVTAAGTAGLSRMPPAIAQALAIEPNRAKGTIEDVEHVVILMQENRSFDHYFGTYNGVRGYTDTRPVKLWGGHDLPIWFQPYPSYGGLKILQDASKAVQDVTKLNIDLTCGVATSTGTVAPFHINYAQTGEVIRSTCHLVHSGIQAWSDGSYDNWIEAKLDVLVMGYLKHQDVSYHRALANSFTICDHYFSSVHGNTNPNRLHLFSGTASDPAVLKGGKDAYEKGLVGLLGPEAGTGCGWKTYPERIEAYNAKQQDTNRKVSWRVYQGGTGDPASKATDNYGDNSLEYFKAYRNDPVKGCYWSAGKCFAPDKYGRYKEKTDVNYDKLGNLTKYGAVNRTLEEFHADVRDGKLPNISWIVPPELYSEHTGGNAPTHGAYYINKVLSTLVEYPDVWSKTVFIINYDENDGFFDHIVPPMPPVTDADGKVSPSLKKGLTHEIQRDPIICKDHPIGFGPRVPCLVISPWSKGGWVCSQVFDHTSVLQFLEARFGIKETNISAWRRAVAGDLTSAFDFANPDVRSTELLNKDLIHKSFEIRGPKKAGAPPKVPADNRTNLPKVENPHHLFKHETSNRATGTRKARPIPYDFSVNASRISNMKDTAKSAFTIDLINRGKAGVCFYIFDEVAYFTPTVTQRKAPTRYTVVTGEPLKAVLRTYNFQYGYSVHGPNGYLFQAKGGCRTMVDDCIDIAVEDMRDKLITTKYGNFRGIRLKINVEGQWKNNFLKVTTKYAKIVTDNGKKQWLYYLVPLPTTMKKETIELEIITLDGWYDVSVEFADAVGHADDLFLRRYAGHMENGKPSTTDVFLTYNQMV
ncbi:phospholipase C, phosphocholine-specific [Phyllobacterium endophyticum]|uniref:phospholipase C n=2 Tax=Phyllobacterium endophyticum TaxID=1149773 RepID=A0A2P7AUQ6_9HYPH|nr:phospholipase C, phosphocholine-specific [Phyllobacterium endophyticum]PSH57883.1 phospholipase C, phosphocholine-specific [Phyllobacterium endophyticum]TYR44090.1 phospholipase C, phosphocholine-specific [Phyllobacterium endophyticum]